MTKVVGVRFRNAGKIYYFNPAKYEMETGTHVIVETARGVEMGTVILPPRTIEDEAVVQPLKTVIRVATEADEKIVKRNKEKEKEAFKICLEKIAKHQLDMKLVDAEYTFDNNKLLFYFTADGRIDFRELVKDLASVFKTRIELRQIGVRDETKILGGIGICGRPLCCHTHLSDFIPVSIKMAKEQNLSLNPTKISGVCGRLMCCLKHEEDTYEELNRRLPGIGDYVTTEDGLRGEVHSVNVLRQLVKVIVDKDDEKEILEYPVEELRFRRRHGKKEQMELSKEELRELERMEQQDQLESQEEKEEAPMGRAERRERSERGPAPEKRERRERSESEERPDRRERTGRDRRPRHTERQQEGSQERGERDRGQNHRSRREHGEESSRRDYNAQQHEERTEQGENQHRNDYRRRQGNRQRRERGNRDWEQNE